MIKNKISRGWSINSLLVNFIELRIIITLTNLKKNVPKAGAGYFNTFSVFIQAIKISPFKKKMY